MTQDSLTSNVEIKELQNLDKKHYFHPTSSVQQHKIGPTNIFTDAQGIFVKDVYGKEYMDGVSSLWNVNVGFGREELADTARDQMLKQSYASSFYNQSNDKVILLSEKLATMTPGDLNVFFYTSGGSESNDSAIKMARHYWKLKGLTEKTKIISFTRGYHGITIGATSATGIPEYKTVSTSNPHNFLHAEPHLLKCELGDKTDPAYENSVRGIVEREGADTVAAVILEPVLGVGGVLIPPEGYLKAVKQFCEENDILMIADEVICGFGRTGKTFGVDNWNIVPDFMTVAKGITSGYVQLGAVAFSESIRDEIIDLSGDSVFFHGFTYSGHPVACAVALKNLEIVESEGLVDNTKQLEETLRKGLQHLEDKHKVTGPSRSIGLMGAIDLYSDPDNKVPFDSSVLAAPQVVQECAERNLILRPLTFGEDEIVALAPPLITNKQQLEQMIEILSDSISAFERKL